VRATRFHKLCGGSSGWYKMKVFGVVVVVVINAKRFIEYRAREEERELLEGVSRSPSPCTARPHNRARQTTTSKFKQSIKTAK